jgi:uncharacterized UPF0160 family protein
MGIFSKKPTIVVHDGKFHADDVFAAAALQIMLGGRGRIVRTRDETVIAAADYVADVGGINDQEKNRFDHHMPEGGGVRPNGIPYASFGLVWKKYGTDIAGSAEIAARIEQKLVCPVDADDNGVTLVQSIHEITPFTLQGFLYTYRPTWKEDQRSFDEIFLRVVAIAEEIIKREIVIQQDVLEAKSLVEAAYANAADKRIIVMEGNYPFQETLMAHPEPLYVVSLRPADTKWKVEAIHSKPFGFENRKSLPETWSGLRDQKLEEATGVKGAVFCHRACFLAVAETKDGALTLAKIAADA